MYMLLSTRQEGQLRFSMSIYCQERTAAKDDCDCHARARKLLQAPLEPCQFCRAASLGVVDGGKATVTVVDLDGLWSSSGSSLRARVSQERERDTWPGMSHGVRSVSPRAWRRNSLAIETEMQDHLPRIIFESLVVRPCHRIVSLRYRRSTRPLPLSHSGCIGLAGCFESWRERNNPLLHSRPG